MSYHSKTNSVAFTNNNRSCYTHARNLTKISPFTLWIPYDLYTVTVIVGGDSGIQADLILACSHIIQAHFAVVRFMVCFKYTVATDLIITFVRCWFSLYTARQGFGCFELLRN